MGWYGSYNSSKAKIIAERTADWGDESVKTKTLAKSIRGSVLWTVRETTYADGRPSEKWIGCDLVNGSRSGEWGYKPMDESVGPCYYDCPLKFLEMAPPSDSQFAAGWRDKVREFHAKANEARAKLKKLAVGDTVKLVEGVTVNKKPIAELKLVSVKPLVGWLPDFGKIRIKPRHIA